MKANEKIYDKNGKLLMEGDVIDTEGATLEKYFDEWYIAGGKNTCWRIEEFSIDNYKDGYKLVDFEKSGNKYDEYFDYLEGLRKSGATNMFGATPYLQEAFSLNYCDAKDILIKWMNNYEYLKKERNW